MRIKISRSRMGTRILIWSFVPTTIILFAVAVTIFFAYQRVTEDLVVGRNEQLARLSARQLSEDLNQYATTLTALTRLPSLYSGNPARQVEVLQQSANQLLVFDAGVLVLDSGGWVTLAQPEQPELIGQNWSDRSFFRETIRSGGLSSAPAFSNVLQVGQANAQVIAVAVPILNAQQNFRGVLVGMFRLGASNYSAFYGGIVKLRLGEAGSPYLVDKSGWVIYHPDETQIGSDYHTQPVVQQVIRRQAGYLRTFDSSGEEILASYAPIPGTPWGLVDEENWNDLLASSRGYGKFLFLLLGLGIVIPTLVVMFGVRQITEPVAKLIAGAQEISGGKYGQQIHVHTGDELEDLTTQFNRMSTELRESYAQLEDRVAARTQELATLNRIAAVASRSLNLEEVMQTALEETLQALKLDMGSAFNLEADGEHLRLMAGCNLPPDFPYSSQNRSYTGSAVELAAQAGQPLAWPAEEFPDIDMRPWLAKVGIAQVITVPLLAKAKLVGVFNMGSLQVHEISPEECDLLASIGQQIGVAVENAHLYQQAEETATLAERTRLARELHNSVTQSLYSVTLFAEAAASQLDAHNFPTAREHLEELRDTAQEALREMRLLIFELRPPALEQKGLSAAIQERLEAVEARGGIQSKLLVEGEERLALDVQKELYFIAQEALNNVLKHARANEVRVELLYALDAVCLEVSDNGIGFDLSKVRRGGMGLEGLRARTRLLGGTLDLESIPGKGTKINVRVPRMRGRAAVENTEEMDHV